jgi:uncharacterized protein YbjT (DUF2867 family)
MKNPVLITAASGTAGKRVVQELASRGTRVRAMVYDVNQADELRLPNVEVIWGDLRDEDSIRSAVQDIDKVYLITPLAKDMVGMTDRVVKAAQDAGVRAIVRHSFFGAEQGRTTAHLLHRECEKIVERSLMGHTMIRPNPLMQNFARFFVRSIKERGELRRSVGLGRTSFIDAYDVGRAAAFVLDGNWHSGKRYCLTGPTAIDDRDVAKELTERLGREVRAVEAEEEEMLSTLVAATNDEWKSKVMMEVLRLEGASLLSTVTNDFRNLTGVAPRSFHQYLIEDIAAFRQEE